MSPPRRARNPGRTVAAFSVTSPAETRRLTATRPSVRRGLSRIEAATYLGISPSKFDELRKANRIAPAKVLDGRLIFTTERLDEFLDALPDENQTDKDDWTASL
jgi:hypothetical protein